MVRSSPRSVPPVDQCPTEIFRSCRALSRRLAALSYTRRSSRSRKAPGNASFPGSRRRMYKYSSFNRLVWLRGRDSNRHLSNRTGRPGSGRCIRLEMGRGPKAGYRGGALQSCQPAAIDETPGRLINRPCRHDPKRAEADPDPGTKNPPRRSGRAWLDASISEIQPNGPSPSSGNVGYARTLFRPSGGRSPSEGGQLHDQRLPRAGARRRRRWTG